MLKRVFFALINEKILVITYSKDSKFQVWNWNFKIKSEAKLATLGNLSCFRNKNIKTVRNTSRYFRNSTIRRELNTTTLRERCNLHFWKFYEKSLDIPSFPCTYCTWEWRYEIYIRNTLSLWIPSKLVFAIHTFLSFFLFVLLSCKI